MDLAEIKELIKILSESEIAELKLKSEGVKLVLRKGVTGPGAATATVVGAPGPGVPAAAGTAPQLAALSATAIAGEGGEPARPKTEAETPPAPVAERLTINAPMVGTFYRASAPGEEPFVQVGDVVEPGQTVCIIEAMKLMNEIEAEERGRIVEILVENGQPVEYGQPLFSLEKV